jgi:hypothetical protein
MIGSIATFLSFKQVFWNPSLHDDVVSFKLVDGSFFSSHEKRRDEAELDAATVSDAIIQKYPKEQPIRNPPLRRARVLIGIISADTKNDASYRKRHRELFSLWNDTRTCSLPEWHATQPEDCELIWTFVIGGNPSASPELLNDSRPILVPKPIPNPKHADVNAPDVSILNIRYVDAT